MTFEEARNYLEQDGWRYRVQSDTLYHPDGRRISAGELNRVVKNSNPDCKENLYHYVDSNCELVQPSKPTSQKKEKMAVLEYLLDFMVDTSEDAIIRDNIVSMVGRWLQ